MESLKKLRNRVKGRYLRLLGTNESKWIVLKFKMYFKFLLCSPNISVIKLPDDSMPATKKGCACVSIYVCMCAKWLQSYQTLRDSMDWAHQTPLSMGLSCPPPGDLSDPDIKLTSHASCVGRQVLYHWCPPWGTPGYSPWGRKESTRLLCRWNSPGKNTAVAIPFPRGSFWPRNWIYI